MEPLRERELLLRKSDRHDRQTENFAFAVCADLHGVIAARGIVVHFEAHPQHLAAVDVHRAVRDGIQHIRKRARFCCDVVIIEPVRVRGKRARHIALAVHRHFNGCIGAHLNVVLALARDDGLKRGLFSAQSARLRVRRKGLFFLRHDFFHR